MKKLLTVYSLSHAPLYSRYFRPSFDEHLSREFVLLPKVIPQTSLTGNYMSPGYVSAVAEKIKFIIENITPGDSEEMLFSDCDIKFMRPLVYNMREYDILFQLDYDKFCTGFMIFRQNERVKCFFEAILKLLSYNAFEDQCAANILLPISNLWYGPLPADLYWTFGNTGKCQWCGEDFTPPSSIITFHSNYTIGIENKIKLLEKVK